MYLSNDKDRSLLTLSPTEYVQAQQDATASNFFDGQQSKYVEWRVRDGFPELESLDEEGLAYSLRKQGHSDGEIRAYLKVLTDPGFNAMNRRGLERLRTRVIECQKIAFRLWGPSHQSLESVPVGVAMLPYVNAGAHPVPNGGNAILMNFGLSYLYDFYNLFNEREQDKSALTKDSVDQLTRLAQAIFGDDIARKELVAAFPRSINASPDIKLQSRIRMAMSFLYVLLHEYGHVAKGHTEQIRSWPSLKLLPVRELHKYCEVLRQWEYEADAFAYDVLCGKHAEAGTPVPMRDFLDSSISSVFMVMGLAVGLGKRVEAPFDTHPIPRKRLFKLFGVASDQEFLKRSPSIDGDKTDSDGFVDKMLAPLLKATGAIKATEK